MNEESENPLNKGVGRVRVSGRSRGDRNSTNCSKRADFEVDPKHENIAAHEGWLFEGRYRPYNPELMDRARELRKNPTKEERMLWQYLRTISVRVLRQRPVGNYIVDFLVPSKNLAIELDGGQHYSEKGKIYDERRTQMLEALGLMVVRYSNADVKERFEAVCLDIWRRVYDEQLRSPRTDRIP